MEMQRSQFALKLMPSFTDFAFLVPLAFLFGRMDGVKTLLSDCDTGWHIRTGEWIIANRAIPTHDIFSFSKPGQPWFAWEWLSDVVMAWMNAHGGLRTVVMFAIIMLSLTFALLYRLLRRKSGPITSISVTILAAAAASVHWLARPHLFTFLFLVLFYGVLEHVRDGRTKVAGVPYLAVLPVTTVLWTNLHGGFLVGIILIGCYGAGALLEAAFSPDAEERTARLRSASGYFASALGCLAASLINPYGYRLHAHMLTYLRDPWNSEHIGEFTSPTFHHPTAVFFEIMLALGAIGAFRELKRRRFAQPILMVVWAHAAFLAVRNIPLFVIVAAPPAASALTYYAGRVARWDVAGWLRALASRVTMLESETTLVEETPRWHLASAIGILLVASVIWAPHPPRRFRAEFDPKRYPTGAIAMLRSEPGSRIFTHDEWGDYLIWSLYPSHRVFVDGRSDFYGDAFEDKYYLDVMKVKYGWEKSLAHFDVDTILLPPDAPFAGALKESAAWRVVYDDGVALVFRRVPQTRGTRVSFAETGEGIGRDREVTKTQASDRAITENKSKT